MIHCCATASTSPSLASGSSPTHERTHEEGVIAKRATGLYYSGKRTREWLKFKAVHEQEVVIVGYTETAQVAHSTLAPWCSRYVTKSRKRWLYTGHVGSGFDQVALKSLYETMQPLAHGQEAFATEGEDTRTRPPGLFPSSLAR